MWLSSSKEILLSHSVSTEILLRRWGVMREKDEKEFLISVLTYGRNMAAIAASIGLVAAVSCFVGGFPVACFLYSLATLILFALACLAHTRLRKILTPT